MLIGRHADPQRITACLLGGSDLGDPGDIERLVEVGCPCATAGRCRRRRPPRGADRAPSRAERATEVTLALGWALVAAGRAGEVDALVSERFGPSHHAEPIAVHRPRHRPASLTGGLDIVAARYVGADVPRLEAEFDTAIPTWWTPPPSWRC